MVESQIELYVVVKRAVYLCVYIYIFFNCTVVIYFFTLFEVSEILHSCTLNRIIITPC